MKSNQTYTFCDRVKVIGFDTFSNLSHFTIRKRGRKREGRTGGQIRCLKSPKIKSKDTT